MSEREQLYYQRDIETNFKYGYLNLMKRSLPELNLYNCIRMAAENGHTSIVQFLIRIGVEVIPRDEDDLDDDHPLLLACDGGYTSIVKLMLDLGISVDYYGEGALLYSACREGHMDTIKLLLEYGARFDKNYMAQDNPLLEAINQGHVYVVKFVIGLNIPGVLNGMITCVEDKDFRQIGSLLIRNGCLNNKETIERLHWNCWESTHRWRLMAKKIFDLGIKYQEWIQPFLGEFSNQINRWISTYEMDNLDEHGISYDYEDEYEMDILAKRGYVDPCDDDWEDHGEIYYGDYYDK